jgi:hypothetical protein
MKINVIRESMEMMHPEFRSGVHYTMDLPDHCENVFEAKIYDNDTNEELDHQAVLDYLKFSHKDIMAMYEAKQLPRRLDIRPALRVTDETLTLPDQDAVEAGSYGFTTAIYLLNSQKIIMVNFQ